MEQKKLLRIIFSVTLFLLIVVGIGLIWMYPGAQDQPVTAEKGTPGREAGADFDPVEWVRSDNESPGIEEDLTEPGEDDSFVVVYGDPGETLPKKDPEVLSEETGPATPPASPVTPRVTEKTTAPVREKSPAPPVAAEKPAPVTRTVGVTEYWIQTGSYTSRTRADRIKKELDELGLSGRILSKDISGTQYYRVRIGPYEQKAEAEKFLEWVKNRDQFEQSYISQVYRKKTLVQ